jgi:hypothetical protein
MEVRDLAMKSFVFTYRAPAGYIGASPEVLQAWEAFFAQLGSKVTDAGYPVFAREQVGRCGEGTELGGYSIVSAEDLSAAVALARSCPALSAGGGVEVGELTQLDAGSVLSGADDHQRATA